MSNNVKPHPHTIIHTCTIIINEIKKLIIIDIKS